MARQNGVMMQYFHWYAPSDGTFWNQVAANAKDLATAGVTAQVAGTVVSNDSGWAEFRCNGGSVSVWMQR